MALATAEEKRREWLAYEARLKNEPRFAIENLFKIRIESERQNRLIRFNEAQVFLQREIEWFRSRGFPTRLWITKPRRAGMSTGCQAFIFHDTLFKHGTKSVIISNQQRGSETVLRMCTIFWENLPEIIRPKLPAAQHGKPARDKLFFPELDSSIESGTAENPDAFLGSGANNFHATEVARWKQGREIMVALFPTLPQDVNSMFFGESTPLGMNNYFYDQVMIANGNMARERNMKGQFRLLFVPWHKLKVSYATPFVDQFGHDDAASRRHVERSLSDRERDFVKRLHCSLEQINWRRAQIEGLAGDEELFDQEYPSDLETAFLSQGTGILSKQTMLRLASGKRPPIAMGDIYYGESDASNAHVSDTDLVRRPLFLREGAAREGIAGGERFKCSNIDGDYKPLHVWRWPQKGEQLVVACDSGGGNPNGDYSSMEVMSYRGLERSEILMTWRGHNLPVEHAMRSSALCWLLMGLTGTSCPPLLAPEWNGTGVPMNTYINSRNLWINHFKYFDPGKSGQPATQSLGWESNGKTKPMGVGFMRTMLENDELDIPDKRIIEELSSFKEYRGIEGAEFGGENAHDDMVIPLIICASMVKLGKIPGSAAPIQRLSDGAGGGRGALDAPEPYSRADESYQRSEQAPDDGGFDGEVSGMDWGY